MSASREVLGTTGGKSADGAAWPLLAAALEESGDGLVIVRAAPDAATVVFCNRAFTDLTGFAVGETLLEEPFFLCDEPLRGQLRGTLEQALTSGEPQRAIALGNRRNGGVFVARVVMRRLSIPGATRYAAITFVDVSDHADIDAAVQQLPTLVMVFAPDMSVRFANEAAARATGFAVAQMIGRSWYDVMPGADRRREFYARVLGGESLDFLGVPFSRADGAIRFFDTHLRPQRDASGQVTGVLALAEDVTAQHHAIRRLEASEQWLRAVTENSHDIIVVLAADGRVKSLAGNFLQVFGVTAEGRVGRSALDFVHPDDLPRVTRSLESLAATPAERQRDEFRLRRPDGTTCWVDVVCLNMLDDPTVQGIVVNMRDGTGRKSAELALAQARKHLDLAAACAGLALWDCDVATRALVWNDEWYRILGVDPVVGRQTVERMEDGVHPDDLAGYMQSLEECWRGPNDRWERQMRVRTASGQWKWIFDRGRVFERDASGQALRMAGVSIDIDGVKQAEIALKESESRLATTLWGSQVGFWEMRTSTDEIEWWNDWCASVDIDPCAGPNHSPRWDRQTHPEDVALQDASYRALIDGRADTYESEYRMRTRSGEWRWLLSRGRAVERDANGRATRVVGVTFDVDARKRAEHALRETEQRLELAVQGAQLPVWDWDMKHDRLRSNHHWYRALGIDLSPGEAEKREERWLRGVHPEDMERMQAAVAEHVSGNKDFYEAEYRFETAEGTWKWLLNRGKVVEWDENGAPGRMSGVAIDIDERKRMETALRESEAQLETAVWGADLGLWDWDCRTDRCQWLSDWCEKFGFDACAGEGHYESWLTLMHKDDLPSAMAAFDSHITGPKDFYETEYRLRSRSGEWRWVHERGQVLSRDANGRAARVVGVCFDIDARRRAEQNLRETQARLELTVWGSQVGFWDWNLEVEDTRWINDWCRTLDLDPCDGPNHVERWDERIHPDDREDAQIRFDAALHGTSDFYESEYRVLTLSGQWHWIHERGRVVTRAADGRALRMAGICMDIDARKRTEVTLHETETRLGTALWSAGIAYWDWDLMHDTDTLSEHWFAITGYSRANWEQEQDPWRQRVHPDDLPRVDAALRAYVGGRTPNYESEYRLRIASGDWKWLLDRGRIIERDGHGIPTKMAGTSIDIDARKRTERDLELSEYRYRTVAHITPGFVQEFKVSADGDDVLTWVSDGFREIFGCSLEEMQALGGPKAFYHPDDGAHARVRMADLAAGCTTQAEVRIVNVRGETRWLHVVNQPISRSTVRDAKSDARYVIGVCHDITARKNAELALQKSESILRSVTDNVPDWLLLVDLDLNCRFANREFLGRAPAELVGQSVLGLAPPGERERLANVLECAIRSSNSASSEILIPVNTELRHFEARVAPVIEQGAVAGLTVAITEITQRKLAEGTLRTQATILETMREGVAVIARDASVRLTNPAFDRMFGYAPGEIVGRSVADFLGELDFPIGALDRLEFLERHRRQPLERDFLLRRKDGSLFTGEAVMTSLELGDERVWLAVVQDITERKELEHEIIEIANREQLRIGSDLHDGLGQELTGVALMLQGLTGKIKKSDPSLASNLDEIVMLVNHTIESTRALARGLSPVSLDRGGLVFALRSLVHRAREMYGIDVRLRSRVWRELTLDEPTANHLYRIAQEAVSDAARHRQASQISVQLLVEERNVRLTISDNGAGPPKGSADEPRPGASGMGLKIMAHRARMIDGEITVEPLREGGTRVRCRCRQPAPKALIVAKPDVGTH